VTLVIEEAFILQICAILLQAIIVSVIVGRLKPIVARDFKTLFFGCVNTSLGCGST